MSSAVRAEKIAREVDDAARQLAQAGRLDLTHEFIQHGDVTVYAHVTSVARASLSFAERLGRAGISVDRASLLRGALLHDYFLYDWHDPDPSHRLHGFRHPFFALARAEEDFELTSRERNIIVRHMFPLVPVPPTCGPTTLPTTMPSSSSSSTSVPVNSIMKVIAVCRAKTTRTI